MFKRLKAFVWRLSAYRISVIVGLLFCVVLLRVNGRLEKVPVIGRVEHIFHDLKFVERGIRKPSGDVVMAVADENAIKVMGRWPFPRVMYARLIDKLTELGARAVSCDISWIDAAAEGTNASAERLRMEFEHMSLANAEADDVLQKLARAKTDATGAVSAAASLTDNNSATRDVKDRLTPVADTLANAVTVLDRYKQLHADFAKALASEATGKSGDEALATAIHRSGRVVLGSFLELAGEDPEATPQKEKKAIERLKHIEIPFPTIDPVENGWTDLEREPPPVYGVEFRNYSTIELPLDALLGKDDIGTPTQLAFFNTEPDNDGIIRREPLVLSVGDPGIPDQLALFPNIDLGAVLKYYDADPTWTRLWGAGGKDNLQYVAILPNSAKHKQDTPKVSDFKRIPVDPKAQLLLNYYGPKQTFTYISFGDLWNDKVPRSAIEGKLVLFGATATSAFDQRVTPFDKFQPGIEIHATALENILHEDYLTRPWWATPAELVILLVISLLVGFALTRVSVQWGAFVTVGCALAYHALDYFLFRRGYAVFSAYPIAEVFTIYVAQTVYRYQTEEKAKSFYRKAFQFYLNPNVIEEIVKDNSKLTLSGEQRDMTVLFSDIRGFTTISEKLPPKILADLMNEYLTPMTALVFQTEGTLDKYIGDAVMAFWGAPGHMPDHALRCCRTAVAMMRELAKLQERWRLEGKNYPPIDIGLGINSGPMVVGNFGGEQRFGYTVLGDNVNLSSRLEGTNKEYRSHIIISEATWKQCDGQVAARELGAVRVKGKREPVKIFELMDDKPPSGELAEVIDIFNLGIARFREQKWEEARAQFRKVLAIRPDDGPPQAYIEFCNDYEKDPPGPEWDGVYTMTHK